MVDKTPPSRTEGELRSATRQLTELKNALDQASIVAITDRRGVIEHVNDKFCEISQYPREELLGQDHRIINSGHHPQSFFRELWATIGRGQIWRGELRNRAKGGSFYWVDTTIVPLMGEDGKPHRYLAIRTEITARKEAEQRLRQSEALARLGQMAAVVAHEVKNPLAGISGALGVIREGLPQQHHRKVVGTILERLDELNGRLEDLLVYSRPRTPQRTPVRMRSLIDSIISLLHNDPAAVGVEVAVAGDDVAISADPEMLRDAFLNVLINATQAIGGAGTVDLTIVVEDRHCSVSVRDAGSGIPEHDRERIFEPFYTTKSRGTGLGLAIARQVVEGHQGTITARPGSDGGTVVTIVLPTGAPQPAVRAS